MPALDHISDAAVTAAITRYLSALASAGWISSAAGHHCDALRYGLASTVPASSRQHLSPIERATELARPLRYITHDTRLLSLLWMRYSSAEGYYDADVTVTGRGGGYIVGKRIAIRPTLSRIARHLGCTERQVRRQLEQARREIKRALAEDLERVATCG